MTRVQPDTAEQIRPYLPAPLIRAWAANPSRHSTWSEFIYGSLMHCDVTGFTAMSERLAGRGKEGAELMVEILNRFFSRMLGIATSWNAEQLKFGGDAMLLYVPGENHAVRAAACALEMQAAMREFRSVRAGGERHTLKMRIGIHSGEFFLASVGDPENLLHLIVSGADVNRTAEVEPAAAPGKVALSSEARAQMGDSVRVTPLAENLWSLASLVAPPIAPAILLSNKPPRVTTRYVHPILRQRIGIDDSLSGEHRRTTIAFINLFGITEILQRDGETSALAEASEYFSLLLDSLGTHGGFFLGTDAAEVGDKIIALFGSPLSQTQPERAALRWTLDMNDGLRRSQLRLRHRIGVNAGFVFAGDVGSPDRREYTVIGDAVNLAARLMSAARWGEAVVSRNALASAGGEFASQPMRPLRVKGKREPVLANRLLGFREPDEPVARDVLIGRRAELAKLTRFTRQAHRQPWSFAFITGEAGIGKSRLLQELAQTFADQGGDVLSGQGHPHTSHVPFNAWTSPLRKLFGTESHDDFTRFSKAVSRLAPAHAANASLLAHIVNIRAVGPPLETADQLDPAAVRTRIAETIQAALSTRSSGAPLLLVLEDIQWIDQQSSDLLSDLIASDLKRVSIVISSRGDWSGTRKQTARALIVALQPLSDSDATRLVTRTGLVDPERVQTVISRSNGNPLLLAAFATSGSPDAVPETVEDAIASRVDSLSPPLKAVSRIAAVVGPTFDARTVLEMLPQDPESVRRSLGALVTAGIMRREERPGGSYSFSHSVVRDVVYEMLPYARRRGMHAQVTQHLEATHKGQVETICEELLHHSERAEDLRRVARYACLSGDRAARVYAGDAAVAHYQRALGALDDVHPAAPADQSYLLERIGDSLELMGRHHNAATKYEESLETWLSVERPRVRLVPVTRGGDSARTSQLCRKAGVSMERGAEFDASLRWLDRALSALPPRNSRLGAQISAARSVALFRVGRYGEGVSWGVRALGLANRSRDRRLIAYSHNMLATSYMERGELRKAIRHLRQSVRIYHEIGDFPGQASANNNLGMCYHLQGTLDAALYYYQVALATDLRVGDTVDAMIVRSNIGEVMMTLGRVPEAIQNLNDVVQAHRSLGGLTGVAGLAHVNLSRCYLALGNLAAASTHARRGKKFLREAGQAGLTAEAELQRAAVLLAQRRPDLAMVAARRGVAEARDLGALLLEARGHRIVGESLAALGKITSAEAQIKESLIIARRITATHEEAQSLMALARLSMQRNASKGHVVSTLRRAEQMLKRIGATADATEARRLLEACAA